MIGSVNPLGLHFFLHIAEELKPSVIVQPECDLLYENAFCERFFKVLKPCIALRYSMLGSCEIFPLQFIVL